MVAVLKVENLWAKFGNFTLKNISFSLEKGKHLAIVGPTGAGKTSLMEVIAGVRPLMKGKIYLHEKDITNLPAHKRNIAMLYQHLSLFPHYTVRGNIGYPLRWRKGNHEDAEEMARKLYIDHLLDRKIHDLSGGEKQRVALARALIVKPDVLILDEPFSAIDVVTKEQIIGTIKYIQETFSLSTIIITHSPEEAYTLADYIAIIKNGTLVKMGEKEDVWQNPEDIWFAKMTGVKNIIPIEKAYLLGIDIPHTKVSSYTHIGIPPNSLCIEGNVQPIVGTVKEVVHFPDFTEVIADIGELSLICRLAGKQSLERGGEISLYIHPDKILMLKEA